MKIWNNYGLITIIFALSMMIDKSTWRYYLLLLSGGDHNCGIIIYNFGNFSQTYFPRKIPPRFENSIFHPLSALHWEYKCLQSMYKNRVKNDRKSFEVPALLSYKWVNPEEVLRIFLNFNFFFFHSSPYFLYTTLSYYQIPRYLD